MKNNSLSYLWLFMILIAGTVSAQDEEQKINIEKYLYDTDWLSEKTGMSLTFKRDNSVIFYDNRIGTFNIKNNIINIDVSEYGSFEIVDCNPLTLVLRNERGNLYIFKQEINVYKYLFNALWVAEEKTNLTYLFKNNYTYTDFFDESRKFEIEPSINMIFLNGRPYEIIICNASTLQIKSEEDGEALTFKHEINIEKYFYDVEWVSEKNDSQRTFKKDGSLIFSNNRDDTFSVKNNVLNIGYKNDYNYIITVCNATTLQLKDYYGYIETYTTLRLNESVGDCIYGTWEIRRIEGGVDEVYTTSKENPMIGLKYLFRFDNTGEFQIPDKNFTFKYETNGKKLLLTFKRGQEKFTIFACTDSKLTLLDSYGTKFILKKRK